MIQRYNEYNLITESTLKDANLYFDKKANVTLNPKYSQLKKLLSLPVKSKYTHKKDNLYLMLMFTKFLVDDGITVLSHDTELSKNFWDNNVLNDKHIDDATNINGDSLEKLLCYILKYDKYLNYLPIKPLVTYNKQNVLKFQKETDGNTDIGVYELLTDHLVRYLPLKIMSNSWVSQFPSKIKSDYNNNHVIYENQFISLFDTFNNLTKTEKDDIISYYFGKGDELGKISRFNNMKEFLIDFKSKLSGGNKGIDNLVEQINNYGKNGINIVYNENNIVIAVVYTYSASVQFGKDTRWCISDPTDDYQYGRYCGFDTNNKQFFIWDFNLDPTDDLFRIGITLKMNGTVYAAHNKPDYSINNPLEYLSKKGVPVKKIFKPLTASEIKEKEKIKALNDKFSVAVRDGNVKIIISMYNKYKTVISEFDTTFYKLLIKNGYVDIIDELVQSGKYECNQLLSYELPIGLAYKTNKDSYNYFFNNLESFKDRDQRRYEEAISLFITSLKTIDEFKIVVAKYNEINKTYKIEKDINSTGFFDTIFNEDNLELFKYIVETYNYVIDDEYNSNKSTNNIFEYLYHTEDNSAVKIPLYLIEKGYKDNGCYTYYFFKNNDQVNLQKVINNGYDDVDYACSKIVRTMDEKIISIPLLETFKKMGLKFETLSNSMYDMIYTEKLSDDIVQYLNSYGIKDNGYYTLKYYLSNEQEKLDKMIKNGYNDINVVANYIIKQLYQNGINDINALYLLTKMGFKYDYSKENNVLSNMYDRIFKEYDFKSIEYVLEQNPKIIYNETDYSSSDRRLVIYAKKNDSVDKLKQQCEYLLSILDEFKNDKTKNEYHKLIFEYSIINNWFDLFKQTINLGINTRFMNNNINYEKHEKSEFIKFTIINKSKSFYTDDYNSFYYYYPEFKQDIFNAVRNIKININELISYDTKKEFFNELLTRNIITKEDIQNYDLSVGIYINTYDNIKLLFQDLGIKADKRDISRFIEYAVKKNQKKDINIIENDIKNSIEILHKAGSDINYTNYSSKNNVFECCKFGLYQATKYLIDNGATVELTESKRHWETSILGFVIGSNNMELINYFIEKYNVTFDDKNILNTPNDYTIYPLSKEIIFFILDYIKKNNIDFSKNDYAELLYNYSRYMSVDTFKEIYNKIEETDEISLYQLLRDITTENKNSYNGKINNELEFVKFLVEEKHADYEQVYDDYKRSKVFSDDVREYFKEKLKQALKQKKMKKENSNIFSFKEYMFLKS